MKKINLLQLLSLLIVFASCFGYIGCTSGGPTKKQLMDSLETMKKHAVYSQKIDTPFISLRQYLHDLDKKKMPLQAIVTSDRITYWAHMIDSLGIKGETIHLVMSKDEMGKFLAVAVREKEIDYPDDTALKSLEGMMNMEMPMDDMSGEKKGGSSDMPDVREPGDTTKHPWTYPRCPVELYITPEIDDYSPLKTDKSTDSIPPAK